MSRSNSGLNINQLEAATWSSGPLLVLAGPGSGKTRVLTEHIAHLIENSPNERFRVLGMTFTNKAANEMRSRLELRIPDQVDRVRATTFHSFAAELLRQHGSHIGIQPDFSILSLEEDRVALLAIAMESRGLPVDSAPNLISFVDRLLQRGVQDNELDEVIKDDGLLNVMRHVFPAYKKQLLLENRMDFDSLLYFAEDLLSTKSAVARQVRIAYRHICVDEFQDTNLGQYRLLQALVGSRPENLFVVADDDQVIYQWNGASLARLDAMRSEYDMTTVQLPTNYRCPADVIEIANSLIAHNMSRTAGKVPSEAARPLSAPAVRLRRFGCLDDEVAWVAQDIAARHTSERGRCAILGRSRKLVGHAAEAIQAAGLPVALGTRKDGFASPQMQWFLTVLRLSLARGDVACVKKLSTSFQTIEGVSVDPADVAAYASACGGDLLRSWFQRALEQDSLSEVTREFLMKAKQEIVERMEFRRFTNLALPWTDEVEERLSTEENPTGDYSDERAMWLGIARDIDSRFGRDNVTLGLLLQEFDLAPKTPQPPKGAVSCLTIHGAKGLEFAHVYLIGLVEDQLPAYGPIKSGDSSPQMEEERRNCFVAITRTQESLTLTYSDTYFGWATRPSRFLFEMGLLN